MSEERRKALATFRRLADNGLAPLDIAVRFEGVDFMACMNFQNRYCELTSEGAGRTDAIVQALDDSCGSIVLEAMAKCFARDAADA